MQICDFSYDELAHYLTDRCEKPFRAVQIFDWIYQKGVWSFAEMKNLPKGLRECLSRDFAFRPFPIEKKEISHDGTTKLLFRLDDGERVETVLIPTKTRTTVCVSTQAGCKFGCRFCASGVGGWRRNLTCGEILQQILRVKKELSSPRKRGSNNKMDPRLCGNDNVTHIVFMGTGEPLDNYDNLMRAVRIINDKRALNIGARRITVSTCGVIPKIHALAKEGLQIELAVSLHGYDNTSRDVLMPVNRRYPFDDLIKACREYIRATKRQITFEYILIRDITCSDRAARALKKAFRGLICKMNLIPYNPVREFDHQPPSRTEMLAFRRQLEQAGIYSTIRTPRGQDINSACGQLRSLDETPLS